MIHETSFRYVAAGDYIPICSCGWSGHPRGTAIEALAAANAHARAQGAEPQPPTEASLNEAERKAVVRALTTRIKNEADGTFGELLRRAIEKLLGLGPVVPASDQPRRARLILDFHEGDEHVHADEEGWAKIDGSWLLWRSDHDDNWQSWPMRHVVCVEWLGDG